MKRISIKSALKAYYFLLAIDGNIDDQEILCFRDICSETDDSADEYLKELISECDEIIKNASGSEFEEIIQEAFDEAVGEKAIEPQKVIPSRLLLWNMLVLAYANNEYSSSERKMIGHAARILMVEKTVFLEMEQMARTASTLSKERAGYEQSERPYRVIRPIVDELDNRIGTILHAAKCLIYDEIEVDNFYEANEKKNKIADAMMMAGSTISDTAVNAGNKIGGFLKGMRKAKANDKEAK